MKNNAIIRIVLWCLTLAILLSMLAFGMLRTNSFASGYILRLRNRSQDDSNNAGVSGSSFQAEKTDSVRSIQIDWFSGQIDIRPGDLNTVTVSETAPSKPEYTMYCRQNGNKLEISACRDAILSTNGNLKKDLTVLIPRDFKLDTLEIDAASASVNVTDLQIEEVNVNTASGVSQFENCTVEDLDLDTASGDLSYQGMLNNLEVDAASAKITVVAENVPDSIDVDTASGDLKLTLPENAGFTVEMDALSSKINSEFPCESRNGVQIYGDGHCRIDVDTMSGRVSIHKSNSSHPELSLKK